MSKFSTNDIDEIEQRLNEKLGSINSDNAVKENVELKNLLDELHLHQIELEMKNRQLRESQSDLEKTRDKYTNL